MSAFAPEILTEVAHFPITNTLVNTLLVDGILLGIVYITAKKVTLVPSMAQNIAESIIQPMYEMVESIAGNRVVHIFPYFMTFFVFILFANWSGLIPGIGTFGFFHHTEEGKELIPLFRGATSDVNTTFALAVISAVATHSLSIRLTGIKDYLSRFFSLNPLNLFIGVLEMISEITKIVSLSFRLFGNIFAGEVVLLTVSGIYAFLFPIPFMMLEIIVGLVQALVFSMLTFVFMSILTTPHHAEHEKAH